MEPQSRAGGGGVCVSRPTLFSIVKILVFVINLPFLRAAPISSFSFSTKEDVEVSPVDGPTLWIYLAVAVGLVLLGGAFAGLTIALMGQVYFQTS